MICGNTGAEDAAQGIFFVGRSNSGGTRGHWLGWLQRSEPGEFVSGGRHLDTQPVKNGECGFFRAGMNSSIAPAAEEVESGAGGRSPMAVPRSRRSHISRSVATDSRAWSRPNMPLWRSLIVKESDSRSGRSRVIQYEVVCISFSGSSSLPSPIFSWLKNFIFLKPTTWERTRTSPWE